MDLASPKEESRTDHIIILSHEFLDTIKKYGLPVTWSTMQRVFMISYITFSNF